MESQREYLERAKAATETRSDSNMARKIGVSRQHLCQFKSGDRNLSEDVMLRLAARANLDPDEALILHNFWAAQGEAKAVYARMLKKFTAIAALMFVIFSPLGSKSASALNYNDNLHGSPGYICSVSTYENCANKHYAIKRLIKRLWRRLCKALLKTGRFAPCI